MSTAAREGVTYHVQIEYREPTYELHTRPREAPFRWTYEVVARNEEQAAQFALRRFHHTTHLSQVGWIREVVKVRVQPTPLR